MMCGVLAAAGCADTRKYDLCIYGGTSAGVVAAVSAARCGMTVVVVEPTEHIGGMTSGGLGYTDIGNKYVVRGIAKDFYRRVGARYGTLEQWIFEPKVADSIMRAYLTHENITLVTGKRILTADKSGSRIRSIVVEQSQAPHDTESIRARYFIDCSYEGDLMARAGVSYVVGREDNSVYGETFNGSELMNGHQFPDNIDPYRIEGDPSSGLLWGIGDDEADPDGTGDSRVQAYNYRICLTSDPTNMIPITRPEGYDSTRYELLLRLMAATPQKQSLNDRFIWSRMPNSKTDINNRGAFSTDMIGMNHSYPDASYDERERIIAEHTLYTKGLLWFCGHDPRVPEKMRLEMQQWGYPADEYPNNGHWTPQLYIREARRMVGEYVATQADCEGRTAVEDGIADAAYTMDSHNCRRMVVWKDGKAMVKNEGNVEVGGGLPYPVSYRSITPQRSECTNLLVPVCLSASHIAYGSIRMEPVFMVVGQSAAVAVAQALENGCSDVQSVDVAALNNRLALDPLLDGSQPDLLADDADSNVEIRGEWEVCRRKGAYGLSYLELQPTDEPCSVTFSIPNIPSSGEYDVYGYMNRAGHLTSRTVFTVEDADGCRRTVIERDRMNIVGQTSGDWMPLGSYRFEQGQTARVTVDNSEADGPMRADAILFVKR